MSRIVALPSEEVCEKIFQLAAQGLSAARIAKEMPLDERTVRAVMRTPAFRTRMLSLRAEVLEVGRARLHAQVELAINTLGRIMATGNGSSSQVRAALAVLDRVGLTSQATGAPKDDEAKRVLAVVVAAIQDLPEARERAAMAIEAEIVDPSDTEEEAEEA